MVSPEKYKETLENSYIHHIAALFLLKNPSVPIHKNIYKNLWLGIECLLKRSRFASFKRERDVGVLRGRGQS